MASSALFLLFAASFVNAAIPGPCMVLTFGRSARAGARAGIAVSLGVLVADLMLVLLAFGLARGAVALSSAGLGAMKWAGIALLLGLALYCLRAGERPPAEASSARRDGLAGLMVGLTSPYNLVFYLALVPQAMTEVPAGGEALAIIAATLGGIALAQAGAVALALGCGTALGRRGRWIDYASAAALVLVAGTAATVSVDQAGESASAGRCWSVDADRRQFVLARDHEGLRPVGDDGEHRAVGGVDRVEVVEVAGAGPHFLGEVGGLHLADVDDAVLALALFEACEFGHLCLLDFLAVDPDRLHHRLGLGPGEVDVQQAVLERGSGHLDAVGQHEAALELARGDAAVQEGAALGVVGLAAADHQLVVLQGDREVVLGEAGDGEGDPVAALVALLDVVGRIAVAA